MKRLAFVSLVLITLFITSACSKVQETLELSPTAGVTPWPTLSPTAANTPSPQTPKPSSTSTQKPSPTRRPTRTLPPAPTETPQKYPVWSDATELIHLDGLEGYWARTSNEFLYKYETYDRSLSLSKAVSPAFKPVTLMTMDLYDEYEDFAWSPDDQFVVYVCHPNLTVSPQICIMGSNGQNPHIIPHVSGTHYFWFTGWLNQQTLMFENYTGGGHVSVDTLDIQKEVLNHWGASIHGSAYTPQNGYIPATSDTSEFDFKLLAISQKFPRRRLEEQNDLGGNILRLPVYRSIPRQQTMNRFEDWLPNGNQMLVFWGYFSSSNWEPQGNDLLLWDVEKNSVRLIAPNGRGGQFSPDGQWLSYLTAGPAKLDRYSRPTAGKIDPTSTSTDYLQLMDTTSGKVQLSIPVVADLDQDDLVIRTRGWAKTAFSPNSRYLAIFTSGRIEVDGNGWPASAGKKDSHLVFLNLLDLQEKKVISSIVSDRKAGLAWSPTSGYLVYQDEHLNWQILNLMNLASIPITEDNGELVRAPQWSYDGQYLSLESWRPLADKTSRQTINILDISRLK